MTTQTEFSLNWDLDTLLPHPERDEFQSKFIQFREDLNELAEESERLPAVNEAADSVQAWGQFLTRYEAVLTVHKDLRSFMYCHAAAEAENKLFQQFEARMAALEPAVQRIETHLEVALKSANDCEFTSFAAADDRLAELNFFLEDSRRRAALRLPREQEKLANELAVDGLHAWGRLYDRISGALRIEVMERGELVKKSPGQVQFDSPHRPVRENNFYAADKAWATLSDTAADAINHIAGTRLTLYRHLGLEDHLDAPLIFNRLNRETLETMWQTIADRKECLLKYFSAKAHRLGIDRLAWYDLTAPLPVAPGEDRGELEWDDACRTVIDTFHGFSSELGEFAQTAFADRWIEAEDREGKRQGGFCTGFPTKKQSRIFMTFTQSVDGMSTLAHELGHAYHSWVLKDRPLLLRSYPMNLAETASTFAEAVLGEQQLRTAESTGVKLRLLDQMLSDAVAFLMNIHARFAFEDRFHRERAEGELSADRLSELMFEAQRETYCDGLAEGGWYPRFWISKLHFYITELPFYNFPYTFGYLLSLGIYATASDFGDHFAEKYREFLIATGCQTTEEAVQSSFGYDLSTPDFWNRSLDIVEQRVNQFVELSED